MGNDNNHSAAAKSARFSIVSRKSCVSVCVCVCRVLGIGPGWPFIWLRWHCKPIQCIVQWANTKQRLNAFCMLPLLPPSSNQPLPHNSTAAAAPLKSPFTYSQSPTPCALLCWSWLSDWPAVYFTSHSLHGIIIEHAKRYLWRRFQGFSTLNWLHDWKELML